MKAAFALFLISTVSTGFGGSLIKLPTSPEGLIAIKQRAEAGDVRAQVAFGDEMNRSMKYSAAEHFYRAAASQGDPDGLCSLAELYHSNRGFGTNATKANFTNALTLHRLASLQGHKRSHFHLGFAYMEGKVFNRDLIQAYAHFNVSGRNAVVDG